MTAHAQPRGGGAPLFTRPFVLLLAAHFLAALGWSSMPLLPLYLAGLGASRTAIGSVMAAGSTGGLLSRPAVGYALDRIGRRPTLIAGVLLQMVGLLLVYAITRVGPLAYAQRVVFGVGAGAIFTGFFATAADHIPVARRTEGIAIFGVAGLLPLAINPLVGSVGFGTDKLRLFFPAVAAAMSPALLLLARVPESLPRRAAAAPRGGRGSWVAALLRRPLWPVWLATVTFAAMVATFMAFATVAAERRGLARPAGIWLAYAFGAIGVRIVGARLPDRVGPSNLVAPALGLYAIAALVAAGAAGQAAFACAGLLAGLGHGYCFPVLTSQVVTRSPDRLRGAALAAFTALWEGASLALTPVAGRVADRAGDAVMFAGLALWAGVALVLWATLEHGAERPRR